MVIDTGGKWWRGDSPNDVVAYLAAYSSESHPADEHRLARCRCGSDSFSIEADGDEGAVRRTCAGCSATAYLCDSAGYWGDSSPEQLVCVECDGRQFNACVGFSLYPERTGVRWVYLCHRCVSCGVLGCVAEWKVGDGDLSVIDSPWSDAG
jgi:hypothetical protein